MIKRTIKDVSKAMTKSEELLSLDLTPEEIALWLSLRLKEGSNVKGA